jgi:hypothetical protein
MLFLGTIVNLQVQPVDLKVGERRREQYTPATMRSVPRLLVEEAGVWGLDEAGDRIPDVHHRAHPTSKLRGTENAISFGLTSHYAAIRARFGPHLADGIAGENILIAAPEPVSLEDVAGGLLVETTGGSVALGQVAVAHPCAPFSRYALGMGPDEPADLRVTEALRFLDGGVRGFYVAYRGAPAEIAIGDRVFVTT